MSVTYTYDEARKSCLEYFDGDEIASDACISKYLLRDSDGNLLEKSPNDYLAYRISNEFKRIEDKYQNPLTINEIREALGGISNEDLDNNPDLKKKLGYGPVVCQGGPTFGIGNPYKVVSLGNCFVLDQPHDSYGGLCLTDQEIVQIEKRRGGCVEENSFVYIDGKGLKKIQDIYCGDMILSYDINTKMTVFRKVLDLYRVDVQEQDRIIIKLSNGNTIKTSKKHPMLSSKENGLTYLPAGELGVGDLCIIPERIGVIDIMDFDKELSDIGWYIGAHTGDGTAGYYKVPRSDVRRLRLRIVGDNENVVRKYKEITNLLSGSKAEIKIEKRYKKTRCWGYINNTIACGNIVSKYFDGRFGEKVYDCDVFSFVKKNNLWLPYLAGLVDTDGHAKDGGSIDLSMCAKGVIEGICGWLSANGFDFHYYCKTKVRKNEKPLHRVLIKDKSLINSIVQFMAHDKKVEKLTSSLNARIHSYVFKLHPSEFESILAKYNSKKYKKTDLSIQEKQNINAIIRLMKRNRALSKPAIDIFEKYGVISKDNATFIKQRFEIVEIIKDEESKNYFDMSVEGTNNYFAGNFGLINIHNCGVDISTIRPKGSAVNNSSLTSDGIVVFMERFSNSVKEVAQGGGRRGALLIGIDCRHPEILNFINAKRDLKKVTGANVSIKWHDDFFYALERDDKYTLRFPVDSPIEKAKVVKEVRAKEIWDAFISAAWSSAEPGCFYWDTVINKSISDCYADFGYRSVISNPCGEIIMSPSSACILMLVDLTKFIVNPFCPDAYIDWNSFDKNVKIATRLIDDLIDLEIEKVRLIIKKIESDPEPDSVKAIEINLWNKVLTRYIDARRTGIGATGLADMLAAMGMKYASDESISFCDSLFRRFQNLVYLESSVLAKERGAFSCWNWELEKNNLYIKNLDSEVANHIEKYGRRNIASLTISPAGTTSLMTRTSSGVEPLFRHSFIRRKKMSKDDEENKKTPDSIDSDGIRWINYEIFHPWFSKWMQVTGKDCVCDSPYAGSSAHEVDPVKKIKLQATIQKYIDHSISNTLNLPKETTEKSVGELYLLAWKEGCKGISIYRDGSRDGVLISTTKRPEKISDSQAPKRPEELKCEIHESVIKGNRWIFMVGLLEGRPYEIFGGKYSSITIPKKFVKGRENTDAIIKKNGKNQSGISTYDLILGSLNTTTPEIYKDIASIFSPDNGSPTRLISMLLRHGTPIEDLCEQIRKIPQEDSMLTFEKGISRVLRKYVADKTTAKGRCPECQSKLIYEGGCVKCSQCSWSRCD